MQASLSYPYNNIQPYTSGNSYQDYQLAINCPVTPSQTPMVQVTPGSPPLILLPSVQSGGASTLAVTQGPTYQNGQISFTVRAAPDPAYAGRTTNVVLNLQLQVSYTCSNPTDGLTPTAALTMFQGSMNNAPLTLTGSNSDNTAFYGHNPMVAGTTPFPPGLFSASVSIQPPGPLGKRRVGDGGDVVINVSGNGPVTCATVQVTVVVNNQSGPSKT